MQIPLLKAAALLIAERQVEPCRVGDYEVTEVDLGNLYFWMSAWPQATSLDIWDRTPGEAKVLNLNWSSAGEITVASFRRGAWEQALLDWARWLRH